ncbi:class I SAM-dependent DNA methyltransferase [Peribacillus alkalitolerans]|uniref:class I SAM-dependent DNA methyltransferase n=1 Tax=Peribacillus alkalitolerans TaxID=1550385 RepID=UPI0013D80F74|nr:class I SAM-dependent methyltransferase [Peribacillus alkalitolerans]
MEYKGSSVYDNEEFFESYLARRNREESPNNIIEKPVLLELIGDVKGKKVLDLGCGEARFGLELFDLGCSYYEGVEGSDKMVGNALKVLEGTPSKIYHSTMETWVYPVNQYDLVVSRMALHYLEDLSPVFNQVFKSLGKSGHFIFSVQHPLLTSSLEKATDSSKRTNWIVDDYFNSGERIEPWIDKEVVKYHRTIEDYYRLLKNAGFQIEDLRECSPIKTHFKSEDEYLRRKRIPLFLIFSCSK